MGDGKRYHKQNILRCIALMMHVRPHLDRITPVSTHARDIVVVESNCKHQEEDDVEDSVT